MIPISCVLATRSAFTRLCADSREDPLSAVDLTPYKTCLVNLAHAPEAQAASHLEGHKAVKTQSSYLHPLSIPLETSLYADFMQTLSVPLPLQVCFMPIQHFMAFR